MINRHIILLTFAVFFLSLVGIFGRLLHPISGYVNTFFGYLVVFILIAVYILLFGKTSHLKLRDKKKELLFLALGQLGSAAFFLKAIQFIDFATAGLLLYSAPLWIALFYLITKEEKLNFRVILSLILGFLGLVLVLNPSEASMSSKHWNGLLFGALSGISYALSFVCARKIKNEYQTTSIIFWSHLLGVILLLPVVFSASFQWQKMTVIYFLGIGLSWAIGYMLLYYSLKFIRAHFAALIALIEPVFIAVWGYLFFQESLTAFTIVGGILLLLNIYIINKQID